MIAAVTLGLVAYNQEKYVRRAIEGAFAQQFSPLEIILSDDCSTDRTFAIMEEMTAAYRGPHQVIARREPTNAGTVQHLINVSRAARGELLVVAAGDDISYPDRASALHAAWNETGAAALASWHDEMDAEGRMLRHNVSFPTSKVAQWLLGNEPQAHRIDGLVATVPGFCAAYPRQFWANLPDPPVALLVEDGLASAMIILRGGVIHRVPRSLVAYRLLEQSASQRGGEKTIHEIWHREQRIVRNAKLALHEFDYLMAQARREGIRINPKTIKAFERGRKENEFVVGCWKDGFVSRLRSITKIQSAVDARFVMPRLFGFRFFASLRRLLQR